MKITSDEYDEIPFVDVESSNIARVAYVPVDEGPAEDATVRGTVYVEFTGERRCYRYEPVPQALHEDMIGAESVGSFFAHNIRERFQCERVEVDD